jgi:hypothetical protein
MKENLKKKDMEIIRREKPPQPTPTKLKKQKKGPMAHKFKPRTWNLEASCLARRKMLSI